MNLERFESEFSKLFDLLKNEGFPNKDDRKEVALYGRFASFHSELLIINSRLSEEIEFYHSFNQYFRDYAMGKAKLYKSKLEKSAENLTKLMIDLSDFYLYTRRFLDTLTMVIKFHFKTIGKTKYQMKDRIRDLLNKTKLEKYKQEIDYNFFNGLEKKIVWVKDFRDCRDGLMHHCHYFVFTTTRKGELGYDIINADKKSWGTDTVKDIAEELQNTINNLADLLEYISENLPQNNSPTP
jgi:hypothetical protein